MRNALLLRLIALIFALTAGGCALFDEDKSTEDWPASRFYEEGKKAMKNGDYKTAIEHFENLQSHHPFGSYAQQAQLEIAYAYYKYEEPDSAIAAADQFIKLYPRNEAVDYAYYIKGLARFPKESKLEAMFSLDPAQQDTRASAESFQFFSELVTKFPDSRYTADAAQRMVHLRNALARNEMYTADYYMKKGAYVAAVNRAKYVIEHYDQTPSVPDALALMIDAYDRLGLADLAADTRRVLQLNYPSHTGPH